MSIPVAALVGNHAPVGVLPKHTPAQSFALFCPAHTPQSSSWLAPPQTPRQSKSCPELQTPSQPTSPGPQQGRVSARVQELSCRVCCPQPQLELQRDQPWESAPFAQRRNISCPSAKLRRTAMRPLLVALPNNTATASASCVRGRREGG